MSRLTFREKAGAVCWQKQLRDQYLAEGIPPVPHLDVKGAIVRPVTRQTAEQIILKYEWLGTMSQTSLHYGIFYGPYCAGVCCVAVNGTGTAGPYVNQMFGIERHELATLARGACVHWAPIGTNSRLVSWTCRLLGRRKIASLVIAYSDADAGEIGTIYQACGWTYIGRSTGVVRPDMELIAPNGRVINRMMLASVAKRRGGGIAHLRRELRAAGWREQASSPKHRYVCVVDKSNKALVARIAAMSLPYPKREQKADSGRPPQEAEAVQVRPARSTTEGL